MIQLSAQTKVLLATQPSDFRKGIDGFVSICQRALAANPRDGQYYVFINRNRSMVRLLHYDGQGYWLATKRLSKGRFPPWPKTVETDSAGAYALLATQLRPLLAGLKWEISQ